MAALIDVENYLKQKYDIKENLINGLLYITDKKSDKTILLNENSLWRELINNRFSIRLANLISLLKSDFTNKFNPIQDYFTAVAKRKVKDDPIAILCSYIEVTGSHADFELSLRKHLVRAVAGAINDQVFNKHCFVLVSKEQNNGKSTLCRWLCPDQLKNYYTENITTDKDSLIALSENFLINLDELSTLMKSEINSLKAVFSKDYVKVRRPYEKKAIISKRICTFLGSTNRSEFLTDESGSVRWICFEIKKINWKYKQTINIDDIWTYAYFLYKNNFDYNLKLTEISENEDRNKSYSITNIEEELIIKTFYPALENDLNSIFLTASDILIKLNEKYTLKNNINIISVGKAMTKLGFERKQKWNGKYQEKGFWVHESK
jgi:predicted P-loop ATPase